MITCPKAWDESQDAWKLHPRRNLLDREFEALIHASNSWPQPNPASGTDLIIWNLSVGGQFSVKSLKKHLYIDVIHAS